MKDKYDFTGGVRGKHAANYTESTTTLSIRTTRLAATVRAFLDRYPSAVAMLDGRTQRESIDTWCTNKHLRAAIDFSLTDNGTVLLAFHDGPRNMWAAGETAPLIESLQQQRMLRFRSDRVRPSGPIRRMLALLLNIGRPSKTSGG